MSRAVAKAVMLDAALDLARRGWVIGPLHESLGGICSCRDGAHCKSRGKHPRTKHGFKDFTRDPDRIRAWWQRWPHANIGGATEASGVVVIDLDIPKRAEDVPPPELAAAGVADGADALAYLAQRAAQPWPQTRTHQSWSGARHLVFRAPPGIEIPSSTSTHGLAWLVDVKARGGQIVLPPSEIDERPYVRCSGDGIPQDVRPLPNWLIELLREKPKPPPRPARILPVGGARAYVAKVVENELRAVATCLTGRNDQLAHSSFILGQFVGAGLLDRDATHDAVTQAAEQAGIEPTEGKAQNTIRRCLEAGARHPRTIPERGMQHR